MIFSKSSVGQKITVLSGLATLGASTLLLLFFTVTFQKKINSEFAERITALGENVADVMAGPLSVVLSFGDEMTPEIIETLQIPLMTVVQRKNIQYAVLIVKDRPLASAYRSENAEGLPESQSTEQIFGSYPLRRTTLSGRKDYEIRIPVKKEGETLGEIALGFDYEAIQRSIRKALTTTIQIGAALIIVFSVLLYVLIYRVIVSPLKKITRIADQISEGDLESVEAFDFKSGDEIGRMNQAFGRMTRTLKELSQASEKISRGDLNVEVKVRSDRDALSKAFQTMSESLKYLIREIEQVSGQLLQSGQEMESISSKSSEMMTQLSGAVSNIAETSTSIAQRAHHSTESVQKASATSRLGREIAEKLQTKMQLMLENIAKNRESTETLGKRSQKIGEIVDIISNIADQTNLLSLNAAIEAARAGESGRGFAVVADEVRKLADSSSKSANDISQLIQQVAKETKTAVASTHETSIEAEESGHLTTDMERGLGEILSSVESATLEMQNIKSSTEDLAASTEKAASSSTQQTSAVSNISEASQNMLKMAVKLKDLVSKFKA